MLSVSQFAEKVNRSKMYIRRLARDGKLEHTRNELGHYRFTEQEAERFIAERGKQGSTAVTFIEETDGEWCSTSEAAEITGLSPTYVNRRCNDGVWTAEKYRGNWRIKLDEVRSYERTASDRDGYVYRVWLTPEQAEALREDGYDVSRLNS